MKDDKLEVVPGAVLTGEPKFETDPVEKITYNITPTAVWSDGVPITCADFQYTADEISSTARTSTTAPATPTSTRSTCPNDEDRGRDVQEGQDVRGLAAALRGRGRPVPVAPPEGQGPRQGDEERLHVVGRSVVRASGTRATSIMLTPNPKYWGTKPHLDKVVFKFEPDTAAEFQAFKSGQVDAIYPRRSRGGRRDQGRPARREHGRPTSKTGSIEALWFNNGRRRSTPRRSVRRSATRSTATRSSRSCSARSASTKAVNSLNPAVIADYSDPEAWSYYKLEPRQGRRDHDGRRLDQGQRRDLGEGRQARPFTIVTTAGQQAA